MTGRGDERVGESEGGFNREGEAGRLLMQVSISVVMFGPVVVSLVTKQTLNIAKEREDFCFLTHEVKTLLSQTPL